MGRGRTGTVVVLRDEYRLEYGRTRRWSRAAAIDLDLAAVLVLGGECRIGVGDQEREVVAPGLALINPGSALRVASAARSRGDVERLVLSLGSRFVESVANDLGFDGRGILVFARHFAEIGESMHHTARRLVLELTGRETGRESALDLAVRLLTLDLVRGHVRVDRTSKLERSRAGVVDRRLRRSLEYMHDNFHRDLSLGEVAAAAYLSEFHFARLFKRLTGQTPHAYLAGVRLDNARRLLAETDLSIAEIGERVGYHSASHFSKVFRQGAGLTPTAFRNALLK